jgi:prophage regulatory protein
MSSRPICTLWPPTTRRPLNGHSLSRRFPLMWKLCRDHISRMSAIMSETKSAASLQAVSGPVDCRKASGSLGAKRAIRRPELRRIVPLADTSIYEMEQRGEFPRRFYLTTRCVAWDLAEVEAWLEQRQRTSDAEMINRAPAPDVRRRKARPVRQ